MGYIKIKITAGGSQEQVLNTSSVVAVELKSATELSFALEAGSFSIIGTNFTNSTLDNANNAVIESQNESTGVIGPEYVLLKAGLTETFDSITIVSGGGGSGPVVSLFEVNATGGTQSTQRVGAGTAIGACSTLVGGESNNASGCYSFLGGGFTNTASGNSSFVGGGDLNAASSVNSVVVGGGSNTVSGSDSTVGGGRVNTASGNLSTVGSGILNTASGSGSVVAGGGVNTASGFASAILGGEYNNTSIFEKAMIVGSNITADRACATFVNNLSIKNIPTASTGLPSGSVWNNGNVLNIV